MPSVGEADDLATRRSKLRSTRLFGGLPESELQALAEQMIRSVYPAGHVVIQEGEPGDRCYLVVTGQAIVSVRDQVGEEVDVATLVPTDTFGETALVSGSPRTASVRAAMRLVTYSLDGATFVETLRRHPEIVARLQARAREMGLELDFRRASPFARLPAATIRKLVSRTRVVNLAAGETVFAQGDPGSDFYLVQHGAVEVRRDSRLLQKMGPGDYFGEAALITGEARTASVVTTKATSLLVLSRIDFNQVVSTDVRLRAHLGEMMRLRLGLAGPDANRSSSGSHLPGRWRWSWRALIGGLVTFGLLSGLTSVVHWPPLVYLTIALGALVGPVTYVTFISESDVLGRRPWRLAVTFGLAALVSVPVAGLAESMVPGILGSGWGAFAIALIEEPAKLIAILWVLRRPQSRFAMDGIAFGAAAGMGFATLESALYGLAAAGQLDQLLNTLWLRAVLSPFGHGTWTAIVCAALWRQRRGSRTRWDPLPAAAFLLSVTLHGLWDLPYFDGLLAFAWLGAIGAAGIGALLLILRHANQDELAAVVRLNPELVSNRAASGQIHCPSCGEPAPRGTHYCARCGAALRAT